MVFEVTKVFSEPRPNMSQYYRRGGALVGGVWRPGVWKLQSTITNDPYMSVTYRSTGMKGQLSFNKTASFIPGRFSAHPYVRYSQTNEQGPLSGTLIAYRTDYGVLWAYARLEGDLILRTNMALVGSYPVLPYCSRAENAAIIQSIAKTTGPQLDLAVNVAEAATTVKMLVSPINALVPLAKSLFRRSNARRRSRKWFPNDPVKYASDKWLELRYGVMPLVNDIEAGRQLVGNLLSSDDRMRSKRSRELVSMQTTASKITRSDPTNAMRIFVNQQTESSGEYYAIHYFRVMDSAAYLQTRLGLNQLGLLNLAWELVPFSFVVDWFIGIGDWLQYMRPAPEIQSLGTVYGRKQSYKVTEHVTGVEFQGPTCLCKVDQINTVKRVAFERFQPVHGVPFLLPQVSSGISSLSRAFDSAALSWQKMPRVNLFKKR